MVPAGSQHGYNSHMIRASVSHARNHFSALLDQVKSGETVLVTERDKPVARIVPAGDTHLDDRIAELIRLGQVRPPLRPLRIEDIEIIRPDHGGYAGVVDAILEEREEGW
jgi:prevent-host-death family protein